MPRNDKAAAVITGGCACGGVRYSSDVEPDFALHCQCRKCQRITGTGHSSLFRLAVTDLQFEGDIRFFEQPADSGAMTSNGFCPSCGSPILGRTDRFPDAVYLHAATLDDPTLFVPQAVVFSEAAQPWDRIAIADQMAGFRPD